MRTREEGVCSFGPVEACSSVRCVTYLDCGGFQEDRQVPGASLLHPEPSTNQPTHRALLLSQNSIAWAAQRGTSVIPKSVTPSRIAQNFQDFVLAEEDFLKVSTLGKRNHRYNDPGTLEWSVDIFEEK
ncbi:hypothetical protein BC936DRAFT_142139 [Jimgerdemannia flammicorona]|uniref:Uncharacterized protein n=1 Tax=Jimgerdemannia flammicorona TaxID=994334 RepID=A0A433A175_9FUNG|nr:hypothetical protein BC936DRAFT_142139 [Jimgerdemannia flammicorona]